MASALHIVAGYSATMSFRQAFDLPRSKVIRHGDILSDGPCSGGPLSVFREQRAEHWGDLNAPALNEQEDGPFPPYDPFEVIDRFDSIVKAQSLALWIGRTVDEQLLLAWLVFELQRAGRDCSNLTVFECPGHWDFVPQLGFWTPAELEAMASQGRMLDTQQVSEAANVWRAYSDAHPAKLVAYTSSNATLPIMQTAMRDLLQRYPDENSGLGSWNEILLRNVEAEAHRDKLAYAIGHAMGTYKSADTIGDIAMFERIIEMAEDQHPLIHIEGSWEHGMRACQGSVTPVGHAVLAGKKNAVKLNGIDEWIGGVHLTDDNVIFRRGTDLLL